MDCIKVVFELVDLLQCKDFCGNVVLKIDICEAFNTLDWSFILYVLAAHGFNNVFCSWILSILMWFVMWCWRWIYNLILEWLLAAHTNCRPCPSHITNHISTTVSCLQFIHNKTWIIPWWIKQHLPQVAQEIRAITIALSLAIDKLVWQHTSLGELTFKNAFIHYSWGNIDSLTWTRQVWRTIIPPSRSFLYWRTIMDCMPSDDNLRKWGLPITSICWHCGTFDETTTHLFFSISFW